MSLSKAINLKASGPESLERHLEEGSREATRLFGDLRDLYKTENADTRISYRNRDHWALLRVLGVLFGRSFRQSEMANEIISINLKRWEQAEQRIAALELHIKSLSTMTYQGVWSEGTFDKGSVVTWGGNLWHANERTSAKPGEDALAWTLCCKKGRDGKDATR